MRFLSIMSFTNWLILIGFVAVVAYLTVISFQCNDPIMLILFVIFAGYWGMATRRSS